MVKITDAKIRLLQSQSLNKGVVASLKLLIEPLKYFACCVAKMSYRLSYPLHER